MDVVPGDAADWCMISLNLEIYSRLLGDLVSWTEERPGVVVSREWEEAMRADVSRESSNCLHALRKTDVWPSNCAANREEAIIAANASEPLALITNMRRQGVNPKLWSSPIGLERLKVVEQAGRTLDAVATCFDCLVDEALRRQNAISDIDDDEPDNDETSRSEPFASPSDPIPEQFHFTLGNGRREPNGPLVGTGKALAEAILPKGGKRRGRDLQMRHGTTIWVVQVTTREYHVYFASRRALTAAEAKLQRNSSGE